jgi:branched-chain amino acid transport system permease protein
MRALLASATRPSFLLLLALGAALPLAFSGNRFHAFIIGITMISVLWAAGMNLLTGYTGLVPLAFAGIAGFSAYGTVYLTMQLHWSFWLAMPLSAVGAALVGVLLGLPSLRLKGFYFALSSLVIQTVITLMFVYFAAFTNGDTGINQIPPPDIPFSGGKVIDGIWLDLLVTLAAWIGVIGIQVITVSPLGQRLIAVREDEVLADAIGIDVTYNKMLAFFIGSLYAGVGGALYASYVGFISPRNFDVLSSLNVWLMVTFGGRGTILGPIIGTLILAPVPFLLQQYDSLKDVIYGVLIIVVIILLPAGLYGEVLRKPWAIRLTARIKQTWPRMLR